MKDTPGEDAASWVQHPPWPDAKNRDTESDILLKAMSEPCILGKYELIHR